MTACLLTHRGLLITPVPTASQTDINVQIYELLLGESGDLNSGAQGTGSSAALVRDASPMRTTNWGFHLPTGLQVSTAHTGSLGMDTGVVQPNQDIWGWAIGNSTTGDTDFRLSHQNPNSWPAMPVGYDRAAPVYWNHTDGAGHLKFQLEKSGLYTRYIRGYSPQVAAGLYSTPTFIPLVGYVSPTGGGINRFRVISGNLSKQVLVGSDPSTWDLEKTGNNQSLIDTIELSGYAGGVYVYSTDPGFILQISGFDDII
jgi:hypothetical protein